MTSPFVGRQASRRQPPLCPSRGHPLGHVFNSWSVSRASTPSQETPHGPSDHQNRPPRSHPEARLARDRHHRRRGTQPGPRRSNLPGSSGPSSSGRSRRYRPGNPRGDRQTARTQSTTAAKLRPQWRPLVRLAPTSSTSAATPSRASAWSGLDTARCRTPSSPPSSRPSASQARSRSNPLAPSAAASGCGSWLWGTPSGSMTAMRSGPISWSPTAMTARSP